MLIGDIKMENLRETNLAGPDYVTEHSMVWVKSHFNSVESVEKKKNRSLEVTKKIDIVDAVTLSLGEVMILLILFLRTFQKKSLPNRMQVVLPTCSDRY